MIKAALIISGWLCVGLGVAGIFLPLLPTTPFLLLASFCFAKSSPRFNDWLLQHQHLGPFIRAWRSGEGINRKVRNRIILLMWLSMIFSALLTKKLIVALILFAIASCVSWYLLRLPSTAKT